MAKKNFKSSVKQSAAEAFFTEVKEKKDDNIKIRENTSETQDITNTVDIPMANGMILPPYRINLKLKGEYKEYLDQVSWENRTTITGYLNNLIAMDMERYKKQKKISE